LWEMWAGGCLPGGVFAARSGLAEGEFSVTANLKTRLRAGFWVCGCLAFGNTSFK
jgi:hypothetical protein